MESRQKSEPFGVGGNLERSGDPAAEGDAVADGELADLDAGVDGERLVQLEHEVAVVADVLAQGGVRRGHHRAVPQRVVVRDQAARLDQVEQALVVVQVVVLVRVHEHEVERPVVLLLHPRQQTNIVNLRPSRMSGSYIFQQLIEDGQSRALAEVDLVRDAGLLDHRQAELVVLAGEGGGEEGVAGVDADLHRLLGVDQLQQHVQELALVGRRGHDIPALTLLGHKEELLTYKALQRNHLFSSISVLSSNRFGAGGEDWYLFGERGVGVARVPRGLEGLLEVEARGDLLADPLADVETGGGDVRADDLVVPRHGGALPTGGNLEID
ncbi:hypothetical protein ACMD2_22750 [Ananas comosus]|uniref:Uncharacterized protein n=1 Tax=Ananas comosus TaxID=4615 RepID=A0A199URZ4_ANACO|nr:hypothetical protein ACMD2_22750 [Ananas comosus]